MMKTVEIHTDGACRHNPGPGGWGALMDFGDKTQELYGGDEITTCLLYTSPSPRD